MIYIIDEPSVGLHPEDISKINEILKSLKEKGNTILIVEHDPDVIKEADYIIDMGPSSGTQGGEITFEGTYKQLLSSDTSTGEALRIKHHLKNETREAKRFYHLGPVTQNNLNNVTVDIPKHVLTVLTGVAGSGKSTLVKAGFAKNDNAVFMDQKAIQGSNRSNLLTYLGVFDRVRNFFSKETGLNYVTLGQPLSTLSGGEIQRVKLGQYLKEDVTDSIFIFDEPTTGLHEADIPILINCFNDLIEQNNTCSSFKSLSGTLKEEKSANGTLKYSA